MTTPDPHRRALRTAALAAAVVAPAAVGLVTPVVAAPPTTWPEPPPMSLLEALLIFAGIPLAAAAVIALLVLAPSLVRGDRQQRGVSSWTEPEWFGGPGDAVPAGRTAVRGELGGPDRTQGAPAGEKPGEATPDRVEESGGASARW